MFSRKNFLKSVASIAVVTLLTVVAAVGFYWFVTVSNVGHATSQVVVFRAINESVN